MAKRRYEISADLVAKTPIHVGSGKFSELPHIQGKSADGVPGNAPPQVARIQRDAAGRPYIPSTTLKGALHQLAIDTGVGKPEIEAAFGSTLKVVDEVAGRPTGQMGRLTVYGASRNGRSPDAAGMPYADTDVLGEGVFVHARTRVSQSAGTAEDGKLFFQEMAAPATRFAFRCAVEARSPAQADALKDIVLALLSHLAGAGLQLGKGEADGFGELRLIPGTLKATVATLDKTGAFEPKPIEVGLPKVAVAAPSARAWERHFRLRCPGPFAVLDASYDSKTGKGRAKDDKSPTNRAQQRLVGGAPGQPAESLPLLLGSSISGALRARARWLAACARLGETPAAGSRSDVDGEAPLVVKGTDEKAIRKAIAGLTPVQRLFGVTGFRGLLEIGGLTVAAESRMNLTSVRIDRFSGAPVENALFTTEAFVGVDLGFRLSVRAADLLDSEDTELLRLLERDIADNGLMLGHGTNKGFGWFEEMH